MKTLKTQFNKLATISALGIALATPSLSFAEEPVAAGTTVDTIALTTTAINVRDSNGQPVSTDTDTDTDKTLLERAGDKTVETYDAAKDKTKELYDASKDKTASVYEKAKDKTKSAYHTVKDKSKKVAHKIGDGAKDVKNAIKHKMTPDAAPTTETTPQQ